MNFGEKIADTARHYIDAVKKVDRHETNRLLLKLGWLVMAEKYHWNEATFPEEYK